MCFVVSHPEGEYKTSKHPNVHFFTFSWSVLIYPYIFEVCHEVKGLMKQKKVSIFGCYV